jgi:hypothetical protein
MSTRRLLLLIERLPEDGAFKMALRDHDWDFKTYIAVRSLNETLAMRADLRAMIAKDEMLYEPILSPRQHEQRETAQQEYRDIHDGLMAHLRGQD